MEMFEIYNGNQLAHDIFLVDKAGATEFWFPFVPRYLVIQSKLIDVL